MRRQVNIKALSLAMAVAGCAVGFAISPSGSIAAQRPAADPNELDGQHRAPEFKSTIPAPQLSQGDRPMWPNQPADATYWSVADIRMAHQRLSAADQQGTKLDPNSALHDFPYWTRTHSMFLMHKSAKTAVDAEQHLGYSQFIVIAGGTGRVIAGGKIARPTLLVEHGAAIPGEVRGPAIVGGEEFSVKEGDWVSIPSNTPTEVLADQGGLTYAVMKINAMLYPWELIR